MVRTGARRWLVRRTGKELVSKPWMHALPFPQAAHGAPPRALVVLLLVLLGPPGAVRAAAAAGGRGKQQGGSGGAGISAGDASLAVAEAVALR